MDVPATVTSKGQDFLEAYLAAAAEITGIGTVASFDRALDRVETIDRVQDI